MPSQTPAATPSKPQQKAHPAEAILREAQGAHAVSRSLLPLLNLLQEPEASGSLNEIKALLKAIVMILGQQSEMLREIKASVPVGPNPIGQR
ncbi:hypothetical protein [Azorhizobium doebereinerae]|uniref:hypothetical protein n=1 Tax=Azorhizobium doebereinerae TaxID=281091 RepID=UPI00048B02F0|nr:hypothetical protein [Azorhizobium doebereinerae]